MKKLYLLAILLMTIFGSASAKESSHTISVINHQSGEYVTIEDGQVKTYTYAYADSDSGQDKSEKKRNRSVSTSRSTSTSNGKTVTTTATSTIGEESNPKSVDQLNVYQLFGDKYKRHPDCVLTVIENSNSKYRELKVNNNAKLVKAVHALVEKDAAQSPNVVRTYNQDLDQVIVNVGYISIGYTEEIDKASCSIFISWL